MTMMIDSCLLKQNPLSTVIYGDEPLDVNLLNDIKENGQLTVITITEDYTIISGHRRCAVLKELGIQACCEIVSFEDELAEKRAILSYNNQRDKTFSQKMREARELETIVKAQAHERKISNLKQSDTPTLAERGETRDIVSQAIGMKHSSYLKVKAVFDKAEAGDKIAKIIMDKLDAKEITANEASNLLKLSELAHTGDMTAQVMLPDALEGKVPYKNVIVEAKFLAENNPPGLKVCHPIGSELVKISALKEHQSHYELLGNDPDLIDMIAESIAKRGLKHSPIVTNDNVIIDGHARIRALEKLGASYIYVCRKHYESEYDEYDAMIDYARSESNSYSPSQISAISEKMIEYDIDEPQAMKKYYKKFLPNSQ